MTPRDYLLDLDPLETRHTALVTEAVRTRCLFPPDLDENAVELAVDEFLAGIERSGQGRTPRWLRAYRSLPRDVRFNLTLRVDA